VHFIGLYFIIISRITLMDFPLFKLHSQFFFKIMVPLLWIAYYPFFTM